MIMIHSGHKLFILVYARTRVYEVPLQDVVDFKSWGCKSKRGNTGVPVCVYEYDERCEVHW